VPRLPLALLLLAGTIAHAEDVPTARFTAARDVTATKVARATASDPLKIGSFPNPANADQSFGLFCAGANRTLACEARKGDGTVIARSLRFETSQGDVVVHMERTGGSAAWKNVKVNVPGSILSFGGQDMGDF